MNKPFHSPVKLFVFLIFIFSGTLVFSQKATISFYSFIPEFMDISPIKKGSENAISIKEETKPIVKRGKVKEGQLNEMILEEWMTKPSTWGNYGLKRDTMVMNKPESLIIMKTSGRVG